MGVPKSLGISIESAYTQVGALKAVKGGEDG